MSYSEGNAGESPPVFFQVLSADFEVNPLSADNCNEEVFQLPFGNEAEFELEDLWTYYDRSRAMRGEHLTEPVAITT